MKTYRWVWWLLGNHQHGKQIHFDLAGRYVEIFCMRSLLDAEYKTVKNMLFETVTKYGVPKKLETDNGVNFTSKLFGRLCIMFLENRKQCITPYQLPLERIQKTLNEYLRSFAKEDGTNWDQWLHNYALHASANIFRDSHPTCQPLRRKSSL